MSRTKPGAKFIKLSEFDPDWHPSQEDTAENQVWLQTSLTLSEEIGQRWPQPFSSSVDAIREDRREF